MPPTHSPEPSLRPCVRFSTPTATAMSDSDEITWRHCCGGTFAIFEPTSHRSPPCWRQAGELFMSLEIAVPEREPLGRRSKLAGISAILPRQPALNHETYLIFQ